MLALTAVLTTFAVPRIPVPDGQRFGSELIAMIEAYLRFVSSGPGGLATIAVSVLACIVLVTWAWLSRRADARALLITASVCTLLMVAGYVEGTRLKWWGGGFVHNIPLVVQIASLVPALLLGWLAWMGGYCWLVSRVSYAQLIYLAVGALVVVAAAFADRAELSQGLVDVGDGNVWFNALIFVVIIFGPLVLYDQIRRALGRDLLP
jgi:hypothetical protein